MPRPTAAAALTLTLTLTLLLTACDNDTATPPPFTPSSTPSTPPTPSSPQTIATEGAMAGYRGYIAAVDKMANSGGRDTSGLHRFTTGTMLGSELNQAEIYRLRKWRSVGKVRVVWIKAQTVGPADSSGRITRVTVQACTDNSNATAVDASGKSVKKPGTPTQVVDRMRMRWVGGNWKADFPESRKGGKC